MIQVEDPARCAGCSACALACPKQCISMQADKEGFLYPVVEKEKCVQCGLCERTCPIINKCITDNAVPSAYVCAANDERVRKASTSGGFFAVLAQIVLEEGGIVFGVRWNEEFQTVHWAVKSKEDLKLICHSKYIQSNVGDAYQEAKKYLEQGREVLFSGTPCQISGLKHYLRKDYDQLICCDVVCRGVISPALWAKHLSELENKYNDKISYVNFRNKTRSFHKTRLIIRFESGKVYGPSTNVEWISRFFSDALCLRPSCYKCAFKGINRASDITMFDCWNLQRLVPEQVDDDGGYTNVLVHTPKGEQSIKKVSPYMKIWKSDAVMAEKYDGIMVSNCAKKPESREDFFDDMDNCSIEQLGWKYSPIPVKIRSKELLKNMLSLFHVDYFVR